VTAVAFLYITCTKLVSQKR